MGFSQFWLKMADKDFTDDIVVNAEEEEAGVLVDRLLQPPQGTKWRSVQTRQK